MYIAGNCLMNPGEEDHVFNTAKELKGFIDIFRVKLWGGGTKLDRYYPGIGEDGIKTLYRINKELHIPVITEVHTPQQVKLCSGLVGVWIGARNSMNYSLLESSKIMRNVFIKRMPNMTIAQVIDMYNIMLNKHGVVPWMIERGIDTNDKDYGRWTPDIKIAMVLKRHFPEMFSRFVVDCSHSAGQKDFVKDVYKAFRAIGVRNFMFECTYNGISKTDQTHMLSVSEFKEITKEAS